MKCPILSAGEYTRNVSAPTLSCDCLKEECAWWDNISCCCQITYLKDIASALVFKKEVEL